ncbi:MAG: hypothetical protein JSV53_00830 [candidate division WOR-3 bacterium]|nr:MAG: hypothetical protein JSV53_00830 [candidate division WOR-3 bacterium]
MSTSISCAASTNYCEISCERYLIDAITIWRTNARLKRTFNSEGGKRDD